MDTKTATRLGALAFVVVAIAATAMQFRRDEDSSPLATVAPPRDANSLRDELTHCQSLGAAGAQDNECLRVWAENRRRFLTQGPGPAAPPPAPSNASQPSASYAQSGAN